MYRRRTKAERHANRVMRFEYNHPKNKYVIRRQADRAWQRATAHRIFSECLVKMASEGNEAARMMMFAMNMASGFHYMY